MAAAPSPVTAVVAALQDRLDDGRVGAEDEELGGDQTLLDRLLTPANRQATKRFLLLRLAVAGFGVVLPPL